MFSLMKTYRDYSVYYYCFYADEAGPQLKKGGKFGHAWYGTNNFVVFEGNLFLFWDFTGMTTMHELGHLLIDTYDSNPKAKHLKSKPSVFNDGKHCPNNCVLNYSSNLSWTQKLEQWWEFTYCGPCWKAIEGFTHKPGK